jgi:DDB1- and CUL4-associated factor 7
MAAVPGLRVAQAFPATKIMFLPNRSTSKPDLLASSSNCLRVWKLGEESAELDRILDVRRSCWAMCGRASS